MSREITAILAQLGRPRITYGSMALLATLARTGLRGGLTLMHLALGKLTLARCSFPAALAPADPVSTISMCLCQATRGWPHCCRVLPMGPFCLRLKSWGSAGSLIVWTARWIIRSMT